MPNPYFGQPGDSGWDGTGSPPKAAAYKHSHRLPSVTAGIASYDPTTSGLVDASGNPVLDVQAAIDALAVGGGSFYVNVKDYGAVGDGVTDDTAAITSAIAACAAAGGGIVYFPPGNYLISSTLSIATAGVVLRGAGVGSTIITAGPALATGNVLAFSANFTGLEDLKVYSASLKTGGVGVYVNGVNPFLVRSVRLEHMYDSVQLNNCHVVRILDSTFGNQSRHGLHITGGGNDFYLSNVVMDNSPVATGDGILIEQGDALIAVDCDIIHFANGVVIYPAAAFTSKWHFLTGVICDSNTNDGFVLGGGGGNVYGVTLDNCWSATNTNQGITINSGVTGVNIGDGKYVNNGQHGIRLVGGSHIAIADSLIASNSTSASGTYHGISVAAGITHLTVTGNHGFNGMGLPSTQGYGLSFDSGATDYLAISGNDFTGNATGEINNLAGVTGTHRFIGGSAGMTGGSAATYLDGTGNYSTPPGVPAFAVPSISLGAAAAGGGASSSIRSDSTIAAFDGTIPLVESGAGSTGTNNYAARSNHVHPAAAGSYVTHILLADGHASPFAFSDCLQLDDGSDFAWSDP